ncbi:CehA/McbA family metallohydrolase [Haladaptatus sp. NG-SE-30]
MRNTNDETFLFDTTLQKSTEETMPDERQPTRRSVLKSIRALGAMGIATPGITDVRVGSRGEHGKRIRGHLEPDSPDWVYVPFEVPDDVTELHVSYDYNESEENLLEIGIFDPDGHDLGNAEGFRGWSAGTKDEFMLSRSQATPGYYPGDISAGTWSIVLGPYSISAEGIDYAIDVTMHSTDPGPAFEPQPTPSDPVTETAGWFRGDLHLHTVHSDGSYTPEDLVAGVVDAGLDFFVSTDHSTTTANLEWGKYARSDLLIVNGEEVTTRAGHYNALGLEPDQWIDWRYTPEDDELAGFVQQVHDVGGIAVANHPFCPYEGCGWRFGYETIDAIEVWNGPWSFDDEETIRAWDRMLRKGQYLPAVGGSDAHDDEDEIGLPQTVVHAGRLGRDAILSGLSSGNSYLAASDEVTIDMIATSNGDDAIPGEQLERPPGAPIDVELRISGVPEAKITFHTQDGTVKRASVTNSSARLTYETSPEASAFVRVEIRQPEGEMIALTNPIFVESA